MWAPATYKIALRHYLLPFAQIMVIIIFIGRIKKFLQNTCFIINSDSGCRITEHCYLPPQGGRRETFEAPFLCLDGRWHCVSELLF